MPVWGRGLHLGAEVFLVLLFDELAICFPESVTWIWFEVVYMTDCNFDFVVFFSLLFPFCKSEIGRIIVVCKKTTVCKGTRFWSWRARSIKDSRAYKTSDTMEASVKLCTSFTIHLKTNVRYITYINFPRRGKGGKIVTYV